VVVNTGKVAYRLIGEVLEFFYGNSWTNVTMGNGFEERSQSFRFGHGGSGVMG